PSATCELQTAQDVAPAQRAEKTVRPLSVVRTTRQKVPSHVVISNPAIVRSVMLSHIIRRPANRDKASFPGHQNPRGLPLDMCYAARLALAEQHEQVVGGVGADRDAKPTVSKQRGQAHTAGQAKRKAQRQKRFAAGPSQRHSKPRSIPAIMSACE